MIRRALHRAVLATHRLPGLGLLYRALYRLAVTVSVRTLQAVPGVEGVTLHRGLTGGAWQPGISDIDLILLYAPHEGGDGFFLKAISSRLRVLRRVFPMLGDLWIGNARELSAYLRWGGLRAWEDFPRWRRMSGEEITPVASAGSPEKRRRLDPWVESFISHMELSRRYLRPGTDIPDKSLADMRKLYLDFRRFADFAGDPDEGKALSTREATKLRLPEVGRMTARQLWLDSAPRLARVSRFVLERLASRASGRAVFPAPAAGPEDALLRGVLSSIAAARGVVSDAPYHTYVLMKDNATASEYEEAADVLLQSPVPGVPLVLEPAAWALALQSSYLGAPLGWLNWDGAASPKSEKELYADWGPRAVGETGEPVPLLPERLRWETAAEAAAWMALWWRYLWIAPGWPKRFVHYHLYTRALGLRLILAGKASGPFSDWPGLFDRGGERFPPEQLHLKALSSLIGSFSPFLANEKSPCPRN